ncbi:NTP transferase domain-containing protein, partial [Candidatus Sumerlaeota bacterium]|nr:NTP transferase domain-containing protein [Candidatus Sumerlaeota bacterium]
MIRVPHILIIGSAGRNSGKTLLTTAIIRRLGNKFPLVGLKVTTIRERGGACPRGGKGCGVCSSLEGDFQLTEEKNPDLQKDTSRLLAAGASRVFWLRSLRESLESAMKHFLETAPEGCPIVCESNSARTVVDPSLFLMTKRNDEKENKASAKDVLHLADAIIAFEENAFVPSPDDISFINGNWALRERAAAIILAGGKSARMGVDKSLLEIQGKTMIRRLYERLQGNFEEIIISSGEPEKYAIPGVLIVPDQTPDQGPLMGIVSAMERSKHETNFVVACDIPDMDMHIVRKMLRASEDFDAVVPVSGTDKMEPLFAVYKKKTLPLIRETLSRGKRKVRDFFPFCNVKNLKLDEKESIK